ncbi:hypothetical protein BP5796_03429 [Coleophoma crateriformis]|uniref:Uncharacterized protein n=1 Tax=Coleophoma crateriformis TaxID=565419 RepID=A0A3D8SN40_9HELO|nr:hypothetical protein BP5796_03429 [Coleophoma crateriformis]
MALSSEEPLNVLDLPNVYQKPSYATLKEILSRLKVKPPTWRGEELEAALAEDTKAISSYLSIIASNPLKWFSNDVDEDTAMERREEIWDEASKRIAERCGRSAMPEMIRLWKIPGSSTCPSISLQIREPPLTGDNLGFKTWGTAFTMAKELEDLQAKYLQHIFARGKAEQLSVLELGSGTGLVGLAAAAIWQCEVVLTDLPEICQNLEKNAGDNREVVEKRGGRIIVEPLDWMETPSKDRSYEVVIAADSLYDDEHPQMVANMISQFLARNQDSRALVAVPLRDEHTTKLAEDLEVLLNQAEIGRLETGEWICFDDWEAEGGANGVRCWWRIFGRLA